MSFDKLADLIERDIQNISRLTAKRAIQQHMASSSQQSPEKLAQLFVHTVEMLARYVRSGEPTEYRNYIQQLTIQRLQQGYDMTEFFTMGNILTTVLKEFVDRELPGSDNEAIRRRYYRRLEGLQTLAQSTVVATQVRQKYQ